MSQLSNISNRLVLGCITFLIVISPWSSKIVSADETKSEMLPTISKISHHVDNSGAFNMSVPIEVPLGRNGLIPKLTIGYNSNFHNGWLGVGWDLNLGSIQRNTKYGLDYSVNDFVVTGNGRAELVDRFSDWGSGYYGSKIEEAFTKYFFDGTSWIVTTRQGTKYYYGTNTTSRQDEIGGTFKWCLDKITDTNGNDIIITYTSENGILYLGEIGYNYSNGTPSTAASKIIFSLESRPDILESYKTGSIATTAKRLDTITTYGNFPDLSYIYDFNYTTSPTTDRSLLESITISGSDGVSTTTLPPVNFTPQTGVETVSDKSSWSQARDASYHSGYKAFQTADVNGDGRADFVYDDGGTIRVKLSMGNVFQEVVWSVRTASYSSYMETFALGDVNNDGMADFVYDSGGQIHVIVGRNNLGVNQSTDELWGQRSYSYYLYTSPSVFGETGSYSARFQLADVDGDGNSDFVFSSNANSNQAIHVLFSTGSSFSPATLWGNRLSSSYRIWSKIIYMFSNDQNNYTNLFHLADLNGDGKADLLYESQTNNEIHVILGREQTDLPSTCQLWGNYKNFREYSGWRNFRNYGNFASQYPQYVYMLGPQLGDINGDGLADYVYQATDGINVLYSTGQETSGFTNSHILSTTIINTYEIPFGSPFWCTPQQELCGYYPNCSFCGYESSSTWIHTDEPFQYGLGFQLNDINSDGLADVIYNDTATNIRVLKSTGTTLENAYVWGTRGSAYNPDVENFSLSDINGNGMPELIYDDSANVRVLESAEGLASLYPDLLASIDNGIGANFTISYTPSSNYNNSTTLSGGNISFLPFVINTVSTITSDPAIYESGAYLTTYQFSGGYHDSTDREFRGFGFMQKQNPDLSIEKSWFHQDALFKFKPDITEIWSPNQEGTAGRLLSSTDFNWESIQVGSSNSDFVRLENKRDDIFDLYGSGISQTFYTYFDANGLVSTKTESGTGVLESIVNSYIYENKSLSGWVWRLKEESLSGKIDQTSSGLVKKTTYSYENETGNPLSQEFWWREKTGAETDPRIENLQYDVYGNLQTQRDAKGFDTETTYDSLLSTYPEQITLPSTNGISHVTLYEEYDYRFGRPTKIKDENNNYTTYKYDNLGRAIQIDYPDGGQEVKEYYDDVLPRLVITKIKESPGYDCSQSDDCISKYEYFNGLGRVIETISLGEEETPGNNKSIVFRNYFDGMGHNYLTEGPYFGNGTGFLQSPPAEFFSVANEYDFLGRVIETSTPDGITGGLAKTFYDYNAFDITITDPDQKNKTEKRDSLGQLIEVIEYGDNSQLFHTYYTYNGAGNLLSVVNEDYLSEIFYDSLGRKTKLDDPDMGAWSYTYDPNGNLKTQTDAKNQIVTFDYDGLNRVTTKSYSTSDPQVDYLYDGPNVINGNGRLASLSNTLVTTSYNAYDAMGREKSVARTIDGAAQSYITTYDYDLAGRQASVTYPDNYRVDNVYYPKSTLLHKVIGQDAVESVEYGRFADYEPNAKIIRLIHGNNTATIFTHDPWSTRMTAIVTEDPSGLPANDLQNKGYWYSAAGDIIQINDNLRGITYDYWYDSLHRLKAEVTSGNIENHQTRDEGLLYEYNHLDHINAVSDINYNGTDYSYVYDANGNLTAGPDFTDPLVPATRDLVFNVDNMPTTISHSFGGATDILYDGEGTRARKDTASKQVYYINNLYEVIDGVETKYIFGNDLRLAKVTTNGTNYYHKDHLNSSVVITDANGIKIEASENFPYGLERDQEGTEVSDYKFTDQELDRSTNFYNYDARLYDPLIGRFVSADTMIPDYSDPQSLNRYSYVRNNPLVYIDPTGHTYTMEIDWEITEYSLFGNLENSYGGSFEFNPGEAFVDTFSYVANDFMALGEIMAYDAAALVVGQLSYLYTTPRDFWSAGENLVQGRYADSLESLGAMFFNLIIPRYGLGGGAGWGLSRDENTGGWTHTLGPAFVDSPLNMTDAVNYDHDRKFHHLSWVSGQYTFERSSYRTSGPMGVGYKILGTIPFGIAGWFQDMGIGPQSN